MNGNSLLGCVVISSSLSPCGFTIKGEFSVTRLGSSTVASIPGFFTAASSVYYGDHLKSVTEAGPSGGSPWRLCFTKTSSWFPGRVKAETDGPGEITVATSHVLLLLTPTE